MICRYIKIQYNAALKVTKSDDVQINIISDLAVISKLEIEQNKCLVITQSDISNTTKVIVVDTRKSPFSSGMDDVGFSHMTYINNFHEVG